MKFTSEWIIKGFPNCTQRQFNSIMRDNLRKSAVYWHEKMLAKRFLSGGSNVYHLRNRTFKYVRWAKRKNPDWRPLHATGTLESMVESNWRPLATATSNKINAKVKMQRGHPTKPYVAEEITKTLKYESDELRFKVFKPSVLKDINKIPAKRIKLDGRQ